MNIPHELAKIVHNIINDRANEPENDPIRVLLRKADYHLGYTSTDEGMSYLIVAQETTDDVMLKEHLTRIIYACAAEVAAEVAMVAAKNPH